MTQTHSRSLIPSLIIVAILGLACVAFGQQAPLTLTDTMGRTIEFRPEYHDILNIYGKKVGDLEEICIKVKNLDPKSQTSVWEKVRYSLGRGYKPAPSKAYNKTKTLPKGKHRDAAWAALMAKDIPKAQSVLEDYTKRYE